MKRKHLFAHSVFVLLFILAAAYFVVRAVFSLYAEYTALEKALAYMLFFAEFFVIFHGAGFLYNIYNLRRAEKKETPPLKPLKDYPPVAVLVPARHEPREVLDETFNCLYALDYPAKKLYLLDDSSDEKHKAEARETAQKYGAEIFSREDRHGAKAGIINNCVKTLDEKYIAIFDADQRPMPDFLKKLIPLMESRDNLAFIQTPQFYTNLEESRVAYASNMQQSVFYEYICDGKNTGDSMILCGTNVLVRKEALIDVGGLDESTVTEDFATSVFFHLRGWKTLYVNRVSTFGMAPLNLGAYFKQQNRWAMGNTATFKKVLKEFLKKPRALKPGQWLDYGTTGTYYLIGWAYLVLFACPVLLIFFNIPSFFMDPIVYSLTFIPYFLLSFSIFYASMAERNYPLKGIFKGNFLLFSTIPVYLKATLSGLTGRKSTFEVTAKSGEKTVRYRKLWPQLLVWGINLSAFTWGVNRLYYEMSSAVLVNVGWIGLHLLFLSGIFYFNDNSG